MGKIHFNLSIFICFLTYAKNGIGQSVKDSRMNGRPQSQMNAMSFNDHGYNSICSRPSPPNGGSLRCHQNSEFLLCSATCLDGFEFPDTYEATTELICDLESGRWAPDDEFPDCIRNDGYGFGHGEGYNYQQSYQQSHGGMSHQQQISESTCDRPLSPQGASMRCYQTNEEMKCSAQCIGGLHFPDDFPETIEIECGPDGDWYPYDSFPDCIGQGEGYNYEQSYQQSYQQSHGGMSHQQQISESTCDRPSSPQGASMRCYQTNGEMKCNAKCIEGFQFPDDFPETIEIECGPDGDWYPYDSFPDCTGGGSGTYSHQYQTQQWHESQDRRHNGNVFQQQQQAFDEQDYVDDGADYDADYEADESTCMEPTSPMGGRMNCIRQNKELFCSAICSDGFSFPDSYSTSIELTCDEFGDWYPYDEFPDCIEESSGYQNQYQMSQQRQMGYGERQYLHRHEQGQWQQEDYSDYDMQKQFACTKPQSPRNGVIYCMEDRHEKQCRATCNPGYEFPDRAVQVMLTCNLRSGYWLPKDEFDDCQLLCHPPCENGGHCGPHNVCTCTSGFRGIRCQYSIGLCDFNRLHPRMVAFNCTHNNEFSECHVSCPPGMAFDPPSTSLYRCTVNGLWNPPMAPTCVRSAVCDQPPSPMNGQISCSGNNEYLICRGSCRAGYLFPNGFTELNIQCSYHTGHWSPAVNFDDCIPICDPGCKNGGRCLGHNQCLCTSEYRGTRCEYAIANCDYHTFLMSVVAECRVDQEETACHVSCGNTGAKLQPPHPGVYTCSLDGTWRPSVKPICESDYSLIDKRTDVSNSQHSYSPSSIDYNYESSGSHHRTSTSEVRRTSYEQSHSGGFDRSNQNGQWRSGSATSGSTHGSGFSSSRFGQGYGQESSSFGHGQGSNDYMSQRGSNSHITGQGYDSHGLHSGGSQGSKLNRMDHGQESLDEDMSFSDEKASKLNPWTDFQQEDSQDYFGMGSQQKNNDYGEEIEEDLITKEHASQSSGVKGQHKINPFIDNDYEIVKEVEKSGGITKVAAYNFKGICSIWGYPHIRTFDGTIYTFFGTCSYVLVKDAQHEGHSINLMHNCDHDYHQDIDPRYDKLVETDTSLKDCVREIEIRLPGERYKLSPITNLTLNGKPLEIPIKIGTGVIVERVSRYIVARIPGFTVWTDNEGTIRIVADTNKRGQTSGLCGNFDHKEDDFQSPDGVKMHNIMTFGNSWKTLDNEKDCVDTPPSHSPCQSDTMNHRLVSGKSSLLCESIKSMEYASCHGLVDPEDYFTLCQMDCCALDSTEGCECATLGEYFKECAREGGEVEGGWRRPAVCPLACTNGTVYQECGPACRSTCARKNPPCIHTKCVDGCHCPEGTVLNDGQCIREDECPCSHGKKQYASGEVMRSDCNTCICQGGSWDCTEEICPATCYVSGPHFTTFDALRYYLHSRCPHYLVVGPDFSISVDYSSNCRETESTLAEEPICIKSISILTSENAIVKLKPGFEVVVNGQEMETLPVSAPGVHVSQSTSMFMKAILKSGLEILWDGGQRIIVTAPVILYDKTTGLCGTFNHKQWDDFWTPEGDIEDIASSFAVKWRVDSFCDDHSQTAESINIRPCDRNAHRYDEAVSTCSVLKTGKVFDECHAFVDPEPYYASCMQDICDCQLDVAHCLCTALGNYADVCARKGHPIPWRSQIPECVIHCSVGQVYTDCAKSCSYSCDDIAKPPEECKESCVEGCVCPPGQTMDELEHKCISISSCHCTYSGRSFPPEFLQRRGRELCECSEGQWACRDASASELILNKPTSTVQCSSEDHLVFTDCISQCPLTCVNLDHHKPCTTVTCEIGCKCEDGYVLDTTNGICVLPHQCPCHHSGESYTDGSTLRIECNDCTCNGGEWQCSSKPCPGLCSVWGDSHYKTFDGHMYDFQGECNYELLKAPTALSKDAISVVVHNLPCGSGGVTCAKAVTISSGHDSVTLSKDEPMPIIDPTSGITIREVGMFTLIHVDGGISVQWDHGTRIYVTALPSWKTKLRGLCGDFNDDASDDFKPPSGGVPLSLPRDFVDSWSIYDYCAPAQESSDACENNPERRLWARNKCAILKSELFEPCHTKVDTEEYYRRCMSDACACDTGGDCECFCAAVAAYAHECTRRDIFLSWRSQDLCPIQCEDCDHYSPCISTCEPSNCENYQDDMMSTCALEPCVEGCEPKNCPKGYIRTGPTNKTCISTEECHEQPCTIVNGILYKEGARIDDVEVGDECQSCYCYGGEISCEGLPCTTTLPTTSLLSLIKECELTGWTEWINSKSPTNNGGNDREDLSKLVADHRIPCPIDHIKTIECREADTYVPSEASEDAVTCDIRNGLACHKTGDQECSDYEVRVYCDCSEKEMCPPNHHYEDCAYKCDSLCHSLETELKMDGQCENTENNCIPGCVRKTCLPPFVRRDAETCVLPDACTCTLDDGTLLAPEHTGVNGCQKCQCLNNKVHCMNLAECEGDEIREEKYLIPTVIPPVKVESWDLELSSTPPAFFSSPEVKYPEASTRPTVTPPAKEKKEKKIAPAQKGIRTTTVACSYWSDWINRGAPKKGRKNGDREDTLPFILKQTEGFCNEGFVSDIQCRAVETGLDYTETNEKNLVCDLDHGFECNNREQPDLLCMDYEIRYFCTCEAVETTTIFVRTTTPTHVYPCHDFIELIDGYTPLSDSSLKSSSNRSPNEGPQAARLSTEPVKRKGKTSLPGGSWTAEESDEHQFIEVDLDDVRAIYGIVTKGKGGSNDWVTSYRILYSTDGASYNYYDDESDNTKIFPGNYDSSSEVRHIFDTPFEARFVRIEPVTWESSISLRFDILGCSEAIPSGITSIPSEYVFTVMPITPVEQVCKDPMGFEQGLLADFQLSASSSSDPLLSAKHGKIGSELAWSPSPADQNPYLQVDFIELKNISGVITKGMEGIPAWVTAFKIMYSKDGKTWSKVTDEAGYSKEFPANYDDISLVTNIFPGMVRTRYLRIIPTNHKNAVTLQIEVLGCYHPTECQDPMGIKDGLVNKYQISASSEKSDALSAENGRLDSLKAWSPLSADKNQFIQVDFLMPVSTTGVVTKGKHDSLEWVKEYQVAYSNDGEKWNNVEDENGENVKLHGNSDTDTAVTNLLPEPIIARYIRIEPTRWTKWPSMRFEILGCREALECVEPMGLENGLLTDSQLSSSSDYDDSSTADQARIDSTEAWSPRLRDKFPYLKINFGIPQNVSAVVTKGRENGIPEGWVTSYKIAYENEEGDFELLKDDNYDIKVFQANKDEDSPVVNVLDDKPIETTAIKIIPLTWEESPNLRVEVLGCYHPIECQEPMGMENGMIMDSQISASSFIGEVLAPERARLDSDTAWSAAVIDHHQYIMVDLMEPRNVTGVLSSGRKDADERVISYSVSYSLDGIRWNDVMRNGVVSEFAGSYEDNLDQPKLSMFRTPILARYVKILPTKWENWISMRFELLGCYHPYVCKEPMGLENGLLSDSQITASSYATEINSPIHSRFNDRSSWMPLKTDTSPYLQIEFITPANVSAIVTKGNPTEDKYVTAYEVSYSDDNIFWENVLDRNKMPMKFRSDLQDADSPVINVLPASIETRYIRIMPIDWEDSIALQVELLGCAPEEILGLTVLPPELTYVHGCPDTEDEESSLMENVVIKASSSAPNSNPELVRIGTIPDNWEGTTGGWVPKVDDLQPFLTVEFPEERLLTGIYIEGRTDDDQRVKSLKVLASMDNSTWAPVFDANGAEIIEGNKESPSEVSRYFKEPVPARFVKIIPQTWHKWPSFRMDLRGCYHPSEVTEIYPPLVPLPPALCPEVPLSLSEGCPKFCADGQLCDGQKCVDAVDCKCIKAGQIQEVGAVFHTDDCEKCHCVLGGHSKCTKKECPPCRWKEQSYFGPRCECECTKCPINTLVCETNGECVPEDRWCDGIIDCPDDEMSCATRPPPPPREMPGPPASPKGTPGPPAPPPKGMPGPPASPRVLPVPPPPISMTETTTLPPVRTTETSRLAVEVLEEITTTEMPLVEPDSCEIRPPHIKLLDGQNIIYTPCHHLVLSDVVQGRFNISIHKTGSDHSVEIITKDHNVKIFSGKNVELDGHKYTPAQLALLNKKPNATLIIEKLGDHVIVKAPKLGFEVIFNTLSQLVVQVSPTLKQQVNGLCGVYSGDKDHALLKPDGSVAYTTKQFGDSWATDEDDSDCKEPICDVATQSNIWSACNELESEDFKPCADVLDMKDYIDTCQDFMCQCSLESDFEECKCKSFMPVIEKCIEKLGPYAVKGWRVKHNCSPPVCPEGFVWEDCGPSCQITCGTPMDSDLTDCSKECMSGCFCPEGTLLDGEICVSPDKCSNEVCHGFGDPHMETFDGHFFPFQAEGTFLFAADEGAEFAVQGITEPCRPGSKRITCITGIKVTHYGHTVVVGKNNELLVDEEKVSVEKWPLIVYGMTVMGYPGNTFVVLIPSLSVDVRYYGDNSGFAVKIPATKFFNRTLGLCGNCDGKVAENPKKEYACGWLVQGDKADCLKSVEEMPDITEPVEACLGVKNERIFGACHALVDPQQYISACSFDVEYSGEEKDSVCKTLKEYSRQCCQAGVVIHHWAEKFKCDVGCDNGLEYSSCHDGCPQTCEALENKFLLQGCEKMMLDGCFCPDGKVFKEGKCVNEALCDTCDDDGHLPGDVWSPEICKNCTCQKNLAVECSTETCPATPICKSDESVAKQKSKTRKCCDSYVCVPSPVACPPVGDIPSCEEGEIVKTISDSSMCPEFKCVCDPVTCPPVKFPQDLEEGQVSHVDLEKCCPKLSVECDKKTCPDRPICQRGLIAVEYEGECCTLYRCKPPTDVCVYTHHFDIVDGLQVVLEIIERQPIFYQPGETWKDGLCENCTCKENDGQIVPQCVMEQCPAAEDTQLNEDYELHEYQHPHHCCPKVLKLQCKDEYGNLYLPGEEWESYEDPCLKFSCESTEQGDALKVKKILDCPECPKTADYVPPSPILGQCCGFCRQTKCEEGNEIYFVGEEWIPESNPCQKAQCINDFGSVKIVYTNPSCPIIPEDCPTDKVIIDEKGCCKICNETTEMKCNSAPIPIEETVGFFHVFDPSRGGVCKNENPVPEIKKCSGACHSQSYYSVEDGNFKSVCQCCKVNITVKRQVEMACPDGSILRKDYMQPQTCQCSKCGPKPKEDLWVTSEKDASSSPRVQNIERTKGGRNSFDFQQQQQQEDYNNFGFQQQREEGQGNFGFQQQRDEDQDNFGFQQQREENPNRFWVQEPEDEDVFDLQQRREEDRFSPLMQEPNDGLESLFGGQQEMEEDEFPSFNQRYQGMAERSIPSIEFQQMSHIEPLTESQRIELEKLLKRSDFLSAEQNDIQNEPSLDSESPKISERSLPLPNFNLPNFNVPDFNLRDTKKKLTDYGSALSDLWDETEEKVNEMKQTFKEPFQKKKEKFSLFG